MSLCRVCTPSTAMLVHCKSTVQWRTGPGVVDRDFACSTVYRALPTTFKSVSVVVRGDFNGGGCVNYTTYYNVLVGKNTADCDSDCEPRYGTGALRL